MMFQTTFCLKREKEILLDQMQDSGKPPKILAKIIDGRLRKFYDGVCLTEQGHLLEEETPKVSKCLSQLGLTKVSAFQSVFVQQ
jgi:elongation factor Ts